MKSVNYQFYSVLKYEDATPFVGNNLLIVADGLGGSGSTVHNLTFKANTSLHDEIFKSAFFDFNWNNAQGLSDYLEHLVDPMSDEKPDTSALWGSRIAIARCAYALCCEDRFANADLSDERIRKTLVEFIMNGLERVAKHFQLEKGKYDDQKLLPTTLAFIKYETDIDGTVIAEVVWAGDSRCYMLTQDGLKQLTVDDEDKSGSIKNLFYVGGNKSTVLNYMRYKIKIPCVLMAVSDGVFDPFEPHDNFGFEATILKQISGSFSYEELMDKLKDYFGKIHADDASMAFTAIGFKDFSDMRTTFAARSSYVADMWQKFCEENCALEAVNQSEESICGYIKTRTVDKFTSLISMLLATGENDIAYTDKLKTAVAEAKVKIKKSDEAYKKQLLNEALNKIKTFYAEYTDENFGDCLNNQATRGLSYLLRDKIEETVKISQELVKKIDIMMKALSLEPEKECWRTVIAQKESFYWDEFNRLRSDNTAMGERIKVCRYLGIWNQIDVDFERNFKFVRVNDLEYNDKLIAKEIEAFILNNKQFLVDTAELDKEIQVLRTDYQNRLNELFDLLVEDSSVSKNLFNRQTIEKFGLENSSVKPAGTIETEKIIELLFAEREAIADSIVNSLSEHYNKKSVIDGQYNGTKLELFRTYFRLKASGSGEIKALEEKLSALEKAYTELISNE